jgi:hypothetical protein
MLGAAVASVIAECAGMPSDDVGHVNTGFLNDMDGNSAFQSGSQAVGNGKRVAAKSAR